MISKVEPVRSRSRIWNYLKYRALPKKEIVTAYTPQLACISIIGRCNLNCGYCCSANLADKPEMTLEQLQHIMATPLFKNCMVVDLLGGEPLLNTHLAEMVNWLRGKGYIVNIVTNGVLLDKHIQELKGAGISRISVSLYDANMGLVRLDEINKIFRVHTSIVLTRDLILNHKDKILRQIRYAYDAGCIDVRFWNYRPIGRNIHKEDLITKDFDGFWHFRQEVDASFPGFCLWSEPGDPAGERQCSHLWQRATTNAVGEVFACPGTDLPIPDINLFTDDLNTIYNNAMVQSMRRALLSEDMELPDICKTCTMLTERWW